MQYDSETSATDSPCGAASTAVLGVSVRARFIHLEKLFVF